MPSSCTRRLSKQVTSILVVNLRSLMTMHSLLPDESLESLQVPSMINVPRALLPLDNT